VGDADAGSVVGEAIGANTESFINGLLTAAGAGAGAAGTVDIIVFDSGGDTGAGCFCGAAKGLLLIAGANVGGANL
jgi:hypothetical protein